MDFNIQCTVPLHHIFREIDEYKKNFALALVKKQGSPFMYQITWT